MAWRKNVNEGLVVIVRGLIGFLTLLIFTRVLGKQQVSQLTFFNRRKCPSLRSI
jgi:uncharacterized membrane protein YcaP (DUF421 family)